MTVSKYLQIVHSYFPHQHGTMALGLFSNLIDTGEISFITREESEKLFILARAWLTITDEDFPEAIRLATVHENYKESGTVRDVKREADVLFRALRVINMDTFSDCLEGDVCRLAKALRRHGEDWSAEALIAVYQGQSTEYKSLKKISIAQKEHRKATRERAVEV